MNISQGQSNQLPTPSPPGFPRVARQVDIYSTLTIDPKGSFASACTRISRVPDILLLLLCQAYLSTTTMAVADRLAKHGEVASVALLPARVCGDVVLSYSAIPIAEFLAGDTGA